MVVSFIFLSRGALFLTDYCQGAEFIGLDLVSFSLVVLRIFICFLILVSSNSVYLLSSSKYFYVFVIILIVVLVITFIVRNLLSFYFFV